MRIAITSDIHGNSWALEAVLSDISQKGITTIYDLGDSLYGPLDPKGTFDLILKNNIIKSIIFHYKTLSGFKTQFNLEHVTIKATKKEFSEPLRIPIIKKEADITLPPSFY